MKKVASFGGDWTEEKLKAIGKYLRAYMRIFKGNPSARYYTTIYVDAFASTGSRAASTKEVAEANAATDLNEAEAHKFLKGSASIALEIEQKFDRYLFIELNRESCQELEASLTQAYPELASRIQIENAEANQYLERWCATTDWSKNRSVLFLDPFGMQVEWRLLEAIARTQAIDMWLLFPIGVAVNRLLTRSEPPPSVWAERLTKTLGTDEWRNEFYPAKIEATLFGDVEIQSKDTDFEKIAAYFVRRLRTLFPGVAENPLLLRNSRNVPLYMLCFATGSKKETAKNAALRIAQDILRR